MAGPSKRFMSKGSGGRKAGLSLGRNTPPDVFREKVSGFLDHQRKRVDQLTAGNVKLIEIGALVPPEMHDWAVEMAQEIILYHIGHNDMLVPCGGDGFVILFDAASIPKAEELTKEIGAELADALAADPASKGITAKAFTYDLSRYIDKKWAATVEDLVRIVKLAYQDHALEIKSKLRKASELDRVRFAPVIASAKRMLVGYDVRLYLEGVERNPSSAPHLGNREISLSADDKAEFSAMTVERLSYRLSNMSEDLGNLLLFVPLAPETLTKPLYYENFEEEIFAIESYARRRLVFNLDLTKHPAPARFLKQYAKKLAGKGRGVIVTLPITYENWPSLVDLGLVGVAAASYRRTEEDELTPFVQGATSMGFKTFWFEHHIDFTSEAVTQAGPGYFSMAKATPEINEPLAHYRRPSA